MPHRPSNRAVNAAVLVLVLLLAGCGSSSHTTSTTAPTKARFVSQADAICSAAAAKTAPLIHQLTAAAPALAAGGAQTARQIGALVEQLHEDGASSLAQLRALTVPPGEEKAVESFLSPLTSVVAAAGQAASSLKSGQTGPALGLLAEVESNAQQATSAAQAYGATPCGSVVSVIG